MFRLTCINSGFLCIPPPRPLPPGSSLERTREIQDSPLKKGEYKTPLPPVSSLGRENEKGNMPGQEYNIGKGHWKIENEKGNVPGQEQDSPLKKRPLPHYHCWERRTTKEIWVKNLDSKE